MNQILTCPHCGPTLTQARLRCDRCGRELVYIDEFQFTGRQKETKPAEADPAASRNAKFWFGVAASVAVVVAMAGLMKPGAPTPSSPASPASPAAAPFSPPPAPQTEIANRPESGQPAQTVEVFKPGDLGQALEHYRAALAEKPADAELLDNVGRILVAMNRPAEAVPFLRQAVEAEPFSVIARFDLAVAHARCGQSKEAVEQYEALAQSGSADVRVYHNLGLALRQLGRNAEAAAAFERATALSPDQAPGWLGLALSLEADGRGPEAATALERYLALEPAGADADNVRARIARLRVAAEPAPAPPDTGNDASRRCP